ncbi:MAG TPA: hypothetical protein VEW66_02675 [Thermomicrobiales bacterium]|nr:hypothetical protein [Thermomicrobiales bacterium]
MTDETTFPDDKGAEQEQLAREIGEELTDAFVAYVRGDVAFEDLTFGVFDALSDLHVIASGDYVLEDDSDDEEDTDDDTEDHTGHAHA